MMIEHTCPICGHTLFVLRAWNLSNGEAVATCEVCGALEEIPAEMVEYATA